MPKVRIYEFCFFFFFFLLCFVLIFVVCLFVCLFVFCCFFLLDILHEYIMSIYQQVSNKLVSRRCTGYTCTAPIHAMTLVYKKLNMSKNNKYIQRGSVCFKHQFCFGKGEGCCSTGWERKFIVSYF